MTNEVGIRTSRILTPAMLAKCADALEKGVPADKLAEILMDAIDSTAVNLSDKLKELGPDMLAEHAAEREVFEWRLRQRWKPALDHFEMVLVACTELGSDLHDALQDEAGPESGHPIKLHALTLLHARACLVAAEVFALLRTGFAVGAQARWRTLHEIAVIASIIGDNNEDLANRFLFHRYVDRWKEANCYQENCAALGQVPFSADVMKSFRSEYDKIVGQYEEGYKEDWGWSKPIFPSESHRPNFDDLEKKAGLGHHKPYVKLSHHAIHSGASGTLDILELHGGGEVMLAGPSNAGLSGPGQGALIALFQVTVSLLLNGPNEVLPDDLWTLKGLAKLLDDSLAAFADCHDLLMADDAAKLLHDDSDDKSQM